MAEGARRVRICRRTERYAVISAGSDKQRPSRFVSFLISLSALYSAPPET